MTPVSIRIRCIASALLLALSTAACTARAPLASIPSPLLPTEVKVPVLVALPFDMTQPCEPAAVLDGGINTDVDGSIMTAREHVTALCNARKLKAIEQAQPN